MYGERTTVRPSDLEGGRARATARGAAVAVALATLLAAGRAGAAGPGDEEGAKGLFFARRGECDKATRFLEQAERIRHRPSSALALADCRLAGGDLLGASELYQQVAADKPVRGWTRPD